MVHENRNKRLTGDWISLACVLWLLAGTPFGVGQAAPGATAAVSGVRHNAAGKVGCDSSNNDLSNFERVTEALYRGAQPTEKGFLELKEKFHMDIVVNLRNEERESEAEGRLVNKLGMCYVSMRWDPAQAPDTGLVARFLQVISNNPDKKIFVHCHYGADRTSVMVAAFRLAMQAWTKTQAFEEMHGCHFHGSLFPGMRTYIEQFDKQSSLDPNPPPAAIHCPNN